MLSLFQSLQQNFHFSMKEIFDMSGFEFTTMVESLSLNKESVAAQEREEAPAMTIDEAFPQFFTDPFAKKGEN